MNEFKVKYRHQRARARQRGIPFLLTFGEWLDIWIESGHLSERGCKRDQYNMARIGDVGPYAIGNVKIIKHQENAREVKQTDELRRRKGAYSIGKPSRNRKLTDMQVREIRATYKFRSKTHSTAAFAKKFGVSPVTVWEALHERGWKSL